VSLSILGSAADGADLDHNATIEDATGAIGSRRRCRKLLTGLPVETRVAGGGVEEREQIHGVQDTDWT